MQEFLSLMGRSAFTSLAFFWKAGWAFVLGYAISAMIQAFVPRSRMTRHMGRGDAASVSLAAVFGAASSSCSFAALATARALVAKGASFMAGVAFMFASTNLVIELGILIFIFLGWQFLVAEIFGGFLLIAISSVIIRLTHPDKLLAQAREHLEGHDEKDFDWRKRIASLDGWLMVGMHFVDEWKMVWREVLFGFTLAGVVAVFVPRTVWEAIFLADSSLPGWAQAVQNALVGPLVAAATFIGSMGNIPLATVLASNGVLFAGIMAFIYSDLMVPPLVMVNARYYGWRLALYIAGIMFASIVITALAMHFGFLALGITPQTNRVVEQTATISLDYTFYLDLAFAAVAAVLVRLNRMHHARHGPMDMDMDMGGASLLKKTVTRLAMLWLAVGLVVHALA